MVHSMALWQKFFEQCTLHIQQPENYTSHICHLFMLIEDQSATNGDGESDGLEMNFWEAMQEGYEPAIEDTDWMLDKRSKSKQG